MSDLDDLDLLWCPECQQCHGPDCPQLGEPPAQILDTPIQSKAVASLPSSLSLHTSNDGERGVIANQRIAKRTQFGPLDAPGAIGSEAEDIGQSFVLKVFHKDGSCITLNQSDENQCNWMCLVRPATNTDHQNLIAYQYKSTLYYSAVDDIAPGVELRVWFAQHYAPRVGKELLKASNETTSDLESDTEIEDGPNIDDSDNSANSFQDHVLTRNKTAQPSIQMPKEKSSRTSQLPKEITPSTEAEVKNQGVTAPKTRPRRSQKGNQSISNSGLKKPSKDMKSTKITKRSKLPKKDESSDLTELGNCNNPAPSVKDQKTKSQKEIRSSLDSGIQNKANKVITTSKTGAKRSMWEKKNESSDHTELKTCDEPASSVKGKKTRPQKEIQSNSDSGIQNKASKVSASPKISGKRSRLSDRNESTDFTELGNCDGPADVKGQLTRRSKRLKRACSVDAEDGKMAKQIEDSKDEENTKILEQEEKKKVLSTRCSVESKDGKMTEQIEDSKDIEKCEIPKQEKKAFLSTQKSRIVKSDDVKENKVPCPVCRVKLEEDCMARHVAEHVAVDAKEQTGKCNLKCGSFNIVFQKREDFEEHCSKGNHEIGKSEQLGQSAVQVMKSRKSTKKKKHVCHTCDEPFVTLALLNKHCKSIHDSKKRVVFRRKQSQFVVNKECEENLLDKKEKGVPFKCSECNMELGNEVLLSKHLLKIHSISRYSCKHCPKVFSRKESVLNHRLTHLKVVTNSDGKKGVVTIPESMEKLYKCKECMCEFHKWESFKKHVKIKHCDFDVRFCDICCMVLDGGEDFAAHMMSHDWQEMEDIDSLYECDVCHSIFLTRSKLKCHQNQHTKRKDHVCEICGSMFARSDALLRHKRKHEGKRPIGICVICGLTFKEVSSLTYHMRLHDEDKGSKTYSCNHCEKSFTQLGNYNKHLLTHAQRKQFKCDVCECAFNHAQTLKRHRYTHMEDVNKTYKCEHCDQRFFEKFSLNKHTRDMHLRKYSCTCEYCGLYFKRREAYYRHMRKKHVHVAFKDYKPLKGLVKKNVQPIGGIENCDGQIEFKHVNVCKDQGNSVSIIQETEIIGTVKVDEMVPENMPSKADKVMKSSVSRVEGLSQTIIGSGIVSQTNESGKASQPSNAILHSFAPGNTSQHPAKDLLLPESGHDLSSSNCDGSVRTDSDFSQNGELMKALTKLQQAISSKETGDNVTQQTLENEETVFPTSVYKNNTNILLPEPELEDLGASSGDPMEENTGLYLVVKSSEDSLPETGIENQDDNHLAVVEHDSQVTDPNILIVNFANVETFITLNTSEDVISNEVSVDGHNLDVPVTADKVIQSSQNLVTAVSANQVLESTQNLVAAVSGAQVLQSTENLVTSVSGSQVLESTTCQSSFPHAPANQVLQPPACQNLVTAISGARVLETPACQNFIPNVSRDPALEPQSGQNLAPAIEDSITHSISPGPMLGNQSLISMPGDSDIFSKQLVIPSGVRSQGSIHKSTPINNFISIESLLSLPSSSSSSDMIPTSDPVSTTLASQTITNWTFNSHDDSPSSTSFLQGVNFETHSSAKFGTKDSVKSRTGTCIAPQTTTTFSNIDILSSSSSNFLQGVQLETHSGAKFGSQDSEKSRTQTAPKQPGVPSSSNFLHDINFETHIGAKFGTQDGAKSRTLAHIAPKPTTNLRNNDILSSSNFLQGVQFEAHSGAKFGTQGGAKSRTHIAPKQLEVPSSSNFLQGVNFETQIGAKFGTKDGVKSRTRIAPKTTTTFSNSDIHTSSNFLQGLQFETHSGAFGTQDGVKSRTRIVPNTTTTYSNNDIQLSSNFPQGAQNSVKSRTRIVPKTTSTFSNDDILPSLNFLQGLQFETHSGAKFGTQDGTKSRTPITPKHTTNFSNVNSLAMPSTSSDIPRPMNPLLELVQPAGQTLDLSFLSKPMSASNLKPLQRSSVGMQQFLPITPYNLHIPTTTI